MENDRGKFYAYENLDQGHAGSTLPIRVKSGSITPEKLVISTISDTIEIEWQDIDTLALGIIMEKVDKGEPPKSKIRSMFQGMFMGGDKKDENKKPEFRKSLIIDVFVRDGKYPYRIDGTLVNYRAFLEKPGYISADNFRKLAFRIARHAQSARITPAYLDFIQKNNRTTRKFTCLTDYEIESARMRKESDRMTPVKHIEELLFTENDSSADGGEQIGTE